MKTTLLMLLLPCAAFAQKTNNIDKCKPYLDIHFSKMHFRQACLTMDQEGASILIQNENVFVSQPVNKKTKNNISEDNRFTAENVTITGKQSQCLKADQLTYNETEMKGTLKGHITVSENGVDKEIGSYAVVDFSDNRCRIEKLR
jgi:lipopolysaccharide assembly outer membrane protein LptD (OstA)